MQIHKLRSDKALLIGTFFGTALLDFVHPYETDKIMKATYETVIKRPVDCSFPLTVLQSLNVGVDSELDWTSLLAILKKKNAETEHRLLLANEKIQNQLVEISNYKQRLEEETVYLKEAITATHNYPEIIGESSCMQKIFRMISQVSPSDSTVLILGETGTGKELIARAIHNNSPRKNKVMVKVNCAALPANLIESELFGHERGSFTGATDRRLGKFELAHGGTLFLDEIGEMPIDLQVKLLRALQEKEIERIGGRTTIKVDVRIIAATNRDLEKGMDEGRFRSDLYYRLNIFPVTLPSLRERVEDIPLLTQHFINRFAKKNGKDIKAFSSKALQDMLHYNWPGNIRELEHLIERSILLCDHDTIKHFHLPVKKAGSNSNSQQQYFTIKTMDEYEREYILKVLKHCKGRVGGYQGCADLLNIPSSTLFSRMKKLGIKREMIAVKEDA